LIRIGLFEQVSCHNPNSTTWWSFILEAPLNAGKKPLTKYFEERIKALMTTQKMVMTMETMAEKK
jgi:hypothetical protein